MSLMLLKFSRMQMKAVKTSTKRSTIRHEISIEEEEKIREKETRIDRGRGRREERKNLYNKYLMYICKLH